MNVNNLKPVPVDLKKLNNVIEKEVLKKSKYTDKQSLDVKNIC